MNTLNLVPYDSSMEYTHYDNIHGMCLSREDYFASFAGGTCFPTTPNALAKLAARMIMTGFVNHREFDSCFEMGNGADVMAILVSKAIDEPELENCWRLAEYYLGDFDKAKAKYAC